MAVVRIGQPAGRTHRPQGVRWATLVKETLGHTRMLQWTHVGVVHWFVFVGFGVLFFTLVTAFGQLFDADFALPVIGHWVVYEWATELITWLMLISILGLIADPAHPSPAGRAGPLQPLLRVADVAGATSSRRVILGIGLCILILRGAEYALDQLDDGADAAHYPLTFFIGDRDGRRLSERSAREPDLPGRDGQDRHLVHLDDRARAQHHDGRGVAPLHGLAEHLVQARGATAVRRSADSSR